MVQGELASYQLTFYFVFLLKSLPHVLYSKEVCKWFRGCAVCTSYQLLPLTSCLLLLVKLACVLYSVFSIFVFSALCAIESEVLSSYSGQCQFSVLHLRYIFVPHLAVFLM